MTQMSFMLHVELICTDFVFYMTVTIVRHFGKVKVLAVSVAGFFLFLFHKHGHFKL